VKRNRAPIVFKKKKFLKGKEPEGTSAVREPSAFQSLILELHVNESNGTSTTIEAKAEPFLFSIVLSFSLYSSYLFISSLLVFILRGPGKDQMEDKT
jgi:hypothetical protein